MVTCYKELTRPPLPPCPTSANYSPNWCGYTSCGPTSRPRPRTSPLQASNNNASFDSDIPRYNPVRRVFYGDPRAHTDRFPDSWEAKAFCDGKYPDPLSFISGHLDPDCPKPQHSYDEATMAVAHKNGNKKKSPPTAAPVASVSNSVPNVPAPKSLPRAERGLYV